MNEEEEGHKCKPKPLLEYRAWIICTSRHNYLLHKKEKYPAFSYYATLEGALIALSRELLKMRALKSEVPTLQNLAQSIADTEVEIKALIEAHTSRT